MYLFVGKFHYIWQGAELFVLFGFCDLLKGCIGRCSLVERESVRKYLVVGVCLAVLVLRLFAFYCRFFWLFWSLGICRKSRALFGRDCSFEGEKTYND